MPPSAVNWWTVPTPLNLAHNHYLARQRMARALVAEGRRLWRRVDPGDLRSWSESLTRMLVALTATQFAAAQRSEDYMSSVVDVDPDGRVDPSRLAGIASDGRPLDTLLWTPVVAAKLSIRQGSTIPDAMTRGQGALSTILRTQVADAGRVADGVAIAARPQTGYVRMLIGKTCPRCTVLAGKFYRYSQGFQRHPRCDCFHVPARGEAAAKSEGLMNDPREVFNSLTPAEQDRAYTKAGAQAIREGADMSQVVNARRGMTAAGTTTEGTTRRGLASRGLRGQPRLMPEAIYQAAGDRAEALALLRRHGYLT